MRFGDINKILKGANHLRRMKLYARKTTGSNVIIWIYSNYERKSLGFPPLQITDKAPKSEEVLLLQKAIERRNELERQSGSLISGSKERVSEVLREWVSHFTTESGSRNARQAADKFIETNGNIPAGAVSRLHIIKMIDAMKRNDYNSNYVRCIASRFRAFCNWAEQRGHMERVDTRRLLPPETFGEVKALSEDEIKRLANTPCATHPDVKDLFMFGIYTAQRIGEIKLYTFSLYYDRQIRVRQGKTGKFIIIPLSDGALAIVKGLMQRRINEGKSVEPGERIFNLPNNSYIYKVFNEWLRAAGIPKGKITMHNCRSTAISLLINKGVPESVTQELANHADPRITARYYRQIDDVRKKEALAKIPVF
ncbi:MAG: tyrosine-type recombinase/integrase [Candidatus Fibromonas sp.]|jgi:integrase|nr:tyrosine-type recombinase/integrase [Candidatus Fibromonas sp.]